MSGHIRLSLRSALLGLLTLITSLFLLKLGVIPLYSLGDICLFLVASSSGGLGSFIAACIAEGPLLLTGAHDLFQTVQSVLFITMFGMAIRRQPTLHPMVLFLPTWWIAAAVTSLIAPITFHTLSVEFTLDIFMLAIARLLLLSPVLSQWVFAKQHRLPLASVIPEILFILLAIVSGIILFTQHQSMTMLWYLAEGLSYWFFPMMCFLSLLPIVLGMMLTRTLISEYGIELKNLIAHDWSQKSFVSISRSLLGQRPDSRDVFRDTPKNSIGFSSDESIIFCTEGASEILSAPAATLIGKRIQQSQLASPLIEGVTRLLTASRVRGTAQDEVRIVLPDGTTSKFIELTMTFTKESHDSSSGWLATVTDITAKRTVETELLRAKKIEMLGVMSHGIAHSVADALTVIQSITDLKHDNKTALEEIRSVASNAGSTIKQLLDYASEHQPEYRSSDLHSLLESRLEFFKQTIGDDGCIEYRPHAQQLMVYIDERSVLQAMSHLLINAKESYTSDIQSHGIEISVDEEEISSEFAFIQPGARAGRYARVRVKDTGAGIPTEIFGKIFDPLFTTKPGHTGLGLSVVFAVMRAHDGFLTAESSPKKGTTISLYFPIKATVPINDDKKNISAAVPSRNNPAEVHFKHAIIIEDDDAVRRILELLLKQLGYTFTTFIAGEDAFTHADLHGDFFITDMILPGMQGTEVAQKLVAQLNIPGLIATGGSLDTNKLPNRTRLLMKPYGIEELSAQIQGLKTI